MEQISDAGIRSLHVALFLREAIANDAAVAQLRATSKELTKNLRTKDKRDRAPPIRWLQLWK